MVHTNMNRDKYMDIVDYILEIFNPQDRESTLLETAKTWKDLMTKGVGAKQSYDKHWTEYSSLCVRYAYSHGEVAKSPGVQDLTALLYLLNARLNRTEFSMALQPAMQYQANLKHIKDKTSSFKKSGTVVAGACRLEMFYLSCHAREFKADSNFQPAEKFGTWYRTDQFAFNETSKYDFNS